MRILQITSVPLMEMLQEACQRMVCEIHTELDSEYNAAKRTQLLNKAKQADDMVNHIRGLIKENASDASNPKS